MKIKQTEESILNLAKEYTNMDDFKINEPDAYCQAQDLSMVSQLQDFWDRSDPKKLSDNELIKISLKYKSRSELKNDHPIVYREIYARRIFEKSFANCPQEKLKKDSTDEEILEVARQYKKLHDFMLNDKGYYNLVRDRGLLNKVKAFLELRKDVVSLSDEELIEVAQSFQTRADLDKNEPGVMKEIYKRDISGVALKHMPVLRTVNYTAEELLVEMAKYKSQKEFMTQDSKRFYSAKKKGLLKGYYK